MSNSEQFEKGLKVRRKVLGADCVDGSIAKADDFMMAFQNITTEWCCGPAARSPTPASHSKEAPGAGGR